MAQPSRLTILWNNILDTTMASCETTSGGANPSYPPSNMVDHDIYEMCRTADDSGTKYWLIDLGSGNTVHYDTVGIAGHNFTSAGTYQIGRGGTTTPSLSSVTMTSNTFIHYWDGESTDRYIRFSASQDVTADYLKIGVFWVGMRTELGRNPQIPIDIIDKRETTDMITGGGVLWSYENYTQLGYKMKFTEDFYPAMYASLKDVYVAKGKSKPFFFNLAPQDSNDSALFVHTTDFQFKIDKKDMRPGNWTVEEEK